MGNFVAEYTVPVESDEQLQELLGEKYTPDAGPVQVEATGTQVGELCTLRLTGSLPAIVSWVDAMAVDSEGALQDLAAMIAEGDVKPA